MDLDRLEQLAKNVRPGQWKVMPGLSNSGYTRCMRPDQSEYIAAANPATILALIRVARAAREYRAKNLVNRVDAKEVRLARKELFEALATLEEPS